MNKHFFIVILVLALSACSKQNIDFSNNQFLSSDFSIVVNPVETKTINNGFSTQWEIGDRIGVYYAKSGTMEFNNVCRLDCEDSEKGKFSPWRPDRAPVLEQDTNYDWYILYKYDNNIKTPDGNNGYINLNGFAAQTQVGNNNMAHIAGDKFPIYGFVKDVPSSSSPIIQAKHLLSVLELSITNSLGKDIVVSNIEVTAEKELVGSFAVDFTKEPAEFTPNTTADNLTSKTAQLVIEAGDLIKNNEIGKFYIGVVPGILSTGSSLSVKIEANAGETSGLQIFTNILSEDITLRSGCITTFELNFTKEF